MVRLFAYTEKEPLAADADDGLPAQQWVWTCNFIIKDDLTALIEAAQIAPPVGGVRPMLRLARSIGCVRLLWQRFEHGVIRDVPFDLTEDYAA